MDSEQPIDLVALAERRASRKGSLGPVPTGRPVGAIRPTGARVSRPHEPLSLVRLIGFPLVVGAVSYLLSFGVVVGFGCAFLALAVALVPAGVVRIVIGTGLVATMLAQLSADFSWPFAWGVRWLFFAALLGSGALYTQWRLSDL
jgi:hypothetical protein